MLASFALVSFQVGCGSTSEEETEQEVGLEASSENGAENSAEGLENANVENTESFNAEGNENAFNNFENTGDMSAEGALNNGMAPNDAEIAGTPTNETADLINESAGDAFQAPAGDPGLAAASGDDPFASANDAAAADPFAANSTATDPFAAPAGDANAASGNTATAGVGETGADSGQGSVSLPNQGYVPEDGARMAYMIQVGDTLASISQKIFGSTSGWRQLAEDNNVSNPNLIYAGDVLFYPLNGQSRKFAESYETASRATVTVKAGDSLSSIASRVYGSEGAWRTLWKENPKIQNPDQLTVGMVLTYREGATVSDSTQVGEGVEPVVAQVGDPSLGAEPMSETVSQDQ